MEYVDHDIVRVWKSPNGSRAQEELLAVLYRGDEVQVVSRDVGSTKLLFNGADAWVRGKLRTTTEGLLELAFIDVGQGDACLVTTPSRKRVLVDGGEMKFAARYLAARYWSETVAGKDVHFDAIIVTHGDADHFNGLNILIQDAAEETRDKKRIRVTAGRVFHNGLVKRASSLPDREILGPPVPVGDELFLPVVDDPRSVTDANGPFKRWQKSLNELAARAPLTVTRLDDTRSAQFNFLNDIQVSVLGPTIHTLAGGRAALPMLGDENGRGISAARTINGHSIVLRIAYGNVVTLLTGDLHATTQGSLVAKSAPLSAHVLKVPHHGSDDVNLDFLKQVKPLISIISAGDEDARRDYLHPRANLLAALGRAGREDDAVVFVTNLAAFDAWAGEAFRAKKVGDKWQPDTEQGVFYARERTAYGIIHVRTDGNRLLVIRRGARRERFEPYAYVVQSGGAAARQEIDSI